MKINQEQFDELPQLDRIEFRQLLFQRTNATLFLWIANYVLILIDLFLATFLVIFALYRTFISDRKYLSKLEEQYFNILVKRKIREVKK